MDVPVRQIVPMVDSTAPDGVRLPGSEWSCEAATALRLAEDAAVEVLLSKRDLAKVRRELEAGREEPSAGEATDAGGGSTETSEGQAAAGADRGGESEARIAVAPLLEGGDVYTD